MATHPEPDSGRLTHVNDMHLEWMYVSAVQRTTVGVKDKVPPIQFIAPLFAIS